LLSVTTKRSIWLLPTRISSPVEPVIEIVSVPEVQPEKVQPDRSTESPTAAVMAMACDELVPVMADVFEILPVPSCALPKVAVEVPDVLTKVIPSTLTKPFTPSDAAALRSMLVPAPATPTWITSLPAPPS
jgi:hypothetical protein